MGHTAHRHGESGAVGGWRSSVGESGAGGGGPRLRTWVAGGPVGQAAAQRPWARTSAPGQVHWRASLGKLLSSSLKLGHPILVLMFLVKITNLLT